MNRTRSKRSTLLSLISSAVGSTAIALVAAATVTAATSTAHADPERRRSSLDDQPAVRHRLLLVKHRFELAPMFESTINADFRHILGGGLKLEYHLSDMISFGAIGVYSTSLNTALVDKIVPTLEDIDPSRTDMRPANADPNQAITREPSKNEFTSHLNEMPIHGAAFVSVTPWYGKLAAFSKAFVNFDFYFQAGVAFAQLKSSCASDICDDKHPGRDVTDPDGMGPETGLRDDDPNDDPALNDGNRFGLYLGGGVHVFLTEWMALDLTVRDYAFSDNPSGADFNADLAVTDADDRFLHHLFFGFGVSFMLPPGAKRTP